MNKKRILVLAIVVAILAALVCLQYNTFRKFDWKTFKAETANLRWTYVAIGIGLIYAADIIRALRWKIFLKPVCNARFLDLVAPQFIGFTGLALLGRPGELVRPYIIAKKTGLTVSSQMAVWAVERIFDIGGFATLMVIDVFWRGSSLPFSNVRELRIFHGFTVTTPFGLSTLQVFGCLLIVGVAALGICAWLVRRFQQEIAAWTERHLNRRAPHLAESAASKVRSFSEGLNTIHDASAFLQVTGISIAIWFIIAMAYLFVLHAYPADPSIAGTSLQTLGFPAVVFIMGSSMVGSLLQLPAVGGGTQLATISMMTHGFGVPIELATSAGILLWLVTFVSVVPAGLAIAHREHVSLRELSKEAEREETAVGN